MRTPRTVTLAALLLLGVTGCVSVPSTPGPVPVPSLAPAEDRSPSPVETSRAVQPSPRQTLAPTGPEDRPREGPEAKEKALPEEPAAKRRSGPVRQQRPAVAPPVRRVVPEPERGVHRPRPRPQQPHSPQHRAGHDMRGLCEASDGLTNPDITAMCRATYGSGRR
ncbi:hypothetical protein AB0903_25380 [Streptomyces sp. NPDC048389]|uniref:hypothetical protein n=1 Tax=Streptomyces sp. NPDC048389 TaxID=3154622 RepID=UPI0034567A8F